MQSKYLQKIKPGKLEYNKWIIGFLFIIPATIILLLFLAYPVIDAIRISFYDIQLFSDIEKFIGFKNYQLIFQHPKFERDLINTIIWTFGSLAGQIGLGLIAALAINQTVRGVGIFRNLLIIPYVVPVIALALVWRWMLDGSFGILSYSMQQLNILETHQSPLGTTNGAMISVIVANVWRGFPFVMLMYWAALQSIDEEQYNSAKVDGANFLQEFLFITLPHLKSATLAILVLRLIWTVTYFDLIWLITGGGPAGATEHWPIWIYDEALGYLRFGFAAALGTLMGVVLLLLAGIFSKVFNLGEEIQS